MARVVCVHGIGQQHSGEQGQHSSWFPALADGLRRHGAPVLRADDVQCVFYGDVFRPAGRVLAAQDPLWDATDVDPYEAELLLSLWAEAARTDSAVVPPDARTLARAPRSVQHALDALSRSRFFTGLAMRALIADLKQVRGYLCDPGIRPVVQDRVSAAVTAETRVVVGHSLGSVVAYEALCSHPEWPVRSFVTIGSPLSIRNLIFERLQAAGDFTPGDWPAGIRYWTNVADEGDVVALVKDLRPLFGSGVEGHLVHNGSRAHDATRYLNTAEVGRAVARGCAME